MGMNCCDMCWNRPCTCGHEAREAEHFRQEFAKQFPPLKGGEDANKDDKENSHKTET